jgi:hypothetical protein
MWEQDKESEGDAVRIIAVQIRKGRMAIWRIRKA